MGVGVSYERGTSLARKWIIHAPCRKQHRRNKGGFLRVRSWKGDQNPTKIGLVACWVQLLVEPVLRLARLGVACLNAAGGMGQELGVCGEFECFPGLVFVGFLSNGPILEVGRCLLELGLG
jgi:hypothetical protein